MTAEIDFSSDWSESVRGSLTSSGRFKINYDPNRLPEHRDYAYGQPAWSIVAYVKFSDNGSPESKALKPSGQDSIMTEEFDIPGNADKVILWFVNSDRSGDVAYDSDYGNNYQFSI